MSIFDSCSVGENDPGLSFRSRTSKISGLWKLKAGYLKFTNVYDKGWEANNSNCFLGSTFYDKARFTVTEDYTLGVATATYSKATNGADALRKELVVTSSTYPNFVTSTKEYKFWRSMGTYFNSDPSYWGTSNPPYGTVAEFCKANTLTSPSFTYDYELTIKENGKYSIVMRYSYSETKRPSPQSTDPNSSTYKPQTGWLYSDSTFYEGNWFWAANGKDDKSCITFEQFPILSIYTDHTNKLKSDGTNETYTDGTETFNYVGDVYIDDISINKMDNVTFEIDMLKHKEITLLGKSVDRKNNSVKATDYADRYQSGWSTSTYQPVYSSVTCNATVTDIVYTTMDGSLNFDGDGKDINE